MYYIFLYYILAYIQHNGDVSLEQYCSSLSFTNSRTAPGDFIRQQFVASCRPASRINVTH